MFESVVSFTGADEYSIKTNRYPEHGFSKEEIWRLDESAVKEFLNTVTQDYESLERDYRKASEELKLVRDKLGENASLEHALKDALLSQKATGQIRHQAQRESVLMLKESELKAEKMLDDARLELKALTDDIRNYKTIKRKLKTDLQFLIQSYSDLLSEDSVKAMSLVLLIWNLAAVLVLKMISKF